MSNKNDIIEIVPYDFNWLAMAATEIKLLAKTIPGKYIVDSQHVGSTAIPGLSAKPIIDIQIAVTSLAQTQDEIINILSKTQYVFWPENPDKTRLFFAKGMPPFGKQRTHHLHIVEETSTHWREKIFFRDYLTAHPDVAKKYETLKLKLAKSHKEDREAYTEGKTEFIKAVLKFADIPLGHSARV